DRSHPQAQEIYAMLEKMSWEMKVAGYFSDPEHTLSLYLQIDYVTRRVLPEDLMKFIYKDSLLIPCLFYDVTHGRGSHRGISVSYESCVVKGMAPKAQFATYKVCWMSGCYDFGIRHAFDTAVEDGVDVLSLSRVNSANKHGILLEVVQVLTDLDLTISKAYISSDGGKFMDVFHVTYRDGNKITNQGVIEYIQQVNSANKHGILLEVVQVLTDLDLTISKAYISSDSGNFMDVFHVTDRDGNKITNQGVIEYIQQ
ncbi:hypothetical protein KI387_025402, partial [Taxus chinensis]